MPDSNIAELVTDTPSAATSREKYIKAQQPAVDLELRFRSGREHLGISWHEYRKRQWVDTGQRAERLRLLFVDTVVTIEGYGLARVEELLKEHRLEFLQETDGPTGDLHRAALSRRAATSEPYVVTRITVEPDFDDECAEITNRSKRGNNGRETRRPEH